MERVTDTYLYNIARRNRNRRETLFGENRENPAGKFAFPEPIPYICENMIRNLNIQAWWWRSLTLVNNECGPAYV
mgnify:FL=1